MASIGQHSEHILEPMALKHKTLCVVLIQATMTATVKLLQYHLLLQLNCGVEQTEFTAIVHPP